MIGSGWADRWEGRSSGRMSLGMPWHVQPHGARRFVEVLRGHVVPTRVDNCIVGGRAAHLSAELERDAA